MLDILRRSPSETKGFTLCFDRQPDIFTMAALKYDPVEWSGIFIDDVLAGYGLVGYHEAFVNQAVHQVLHLTDFYIHPEFRGCRYLTTALPRFFDESAGAATLGYAVVMKGNRAPETLVKSDRFASTSCTLRSRFIGELSVQSLLLSFQRRRRSRLAVRRARLDDIEDIVSLLRAEHTPRLFGLVATPNQFSAQLNKRPGLSIDDYFIVEKAGKLAGVCAAWDTSAFKQNRVLRYGFWLRLARPASLLAARLARIPSLPAPGEAFRDVYVTDWAVGDRSVEVMHALVEHIYLEYRRRGYHTLIFGSCAQDPMLEATRGFRAVKLDFRIALLARDEKWLRDGAVSTDLPFIDLALI
jgi:hypothetical protein